MGTITAKAVRGLAAGLVALTLWQAPLGAQQLGWAPLPSDHWSRWALEILEARGVLRPGESHFGPMPGATAEELFIRSSAAPWAVDAILLLRREAAGNARARASVTADLRDGPVGTGDDLGARLGLRLGGPTHRLFGFASWEGNTHPARHTLRRGALGTRLGPLWIQAGRERHQLGGGAGGGLVLSPSAAVEGVTIQTPNPFRVPVLGDVQILAGLGPASRVEAVNDPWFALSRVISRPVSWLQMGFSRGALVGGDFPGGEVPYVPGLIAPPDSVDLGIGDLVDAFLGRVSVFDNQVWALDLRISLAPLGFPALIYGELGLEDNDRSFHDPAVLAGISWAPSTSLPLGVRYEYTAFGPPAALFGSDGLPTWWYQHNRFLDGWRLGTELLGHPLGGYGLQHTVTLTAFSPDLRGFFELSGSRIRRDELNLLYDDRPGWAWDGSATARWRWDRGIEASVNVRIQEGDRPWSVRALQTAVTWYF